jgi:hypothetical protein
MRLFYAAGPGNIVGTFRCWVQERNDASRLALTYSGQFFDLCREVGANGLAVSSHRRLDSIPAQGITVAHVQRASDGQRGIVRHLLHIYDGLQMSWMAIRYRADLMIVADGTAPWCSLRLASLAGVRVMPSFHVSFGQRPACREDPNAGCSSWTEPCSGQPSARY